MTKTAASKKVKKSPTTDSACEVNEYDASIFEIRDRHYGSLLAVKKKIRACEKKLRELEQSTQVINKDKSTNDITKKIGQIGLQDTNIELFNKVDSKKMQLSIWKEAALCIHNARKEELTQGVTNISMADIVEGIDLLKQVVDNESRWDHYKCPNKKHLQKVDIERIRQLGHYLNIQDAANSSNLTSFSSVVDFLSSPIAIGQECPMSFCEFVRMFDKLSKTLLVEIVLKDAPVQTSSAQVSSNVPAHTSSIVTVHASSSAAMETVVVAHAHETAVESTAKQGVETSVATNVDKNKRTRQKRSPRIQKPRKSQNDGAPTDSTTMVNSPIPEKLVVVVTDNSRHNRQHNEDLSNSTTNNSTPIAVSVENIVKTSSAPQDINVEENKEIPSGRLIHHPNVPTDDSDDEGWIVPASNKQKKSYDVETQNYRQSENFTGGYSRGPRRGGDRDRSARNGHTYDKPAGDGFADRAAGGGDRFANRAGGDRFADRAAGGGDRFANRAAGGERFANRAAGGDRFANRAGGDRFADRAAAAGGDKFADRAAGGGDKFADRAAGDKNGGNYRQGNNNRRNDNYKNRKPQSANKGNEIGLQADGQLW